MLIFVFILGIKIIDINFIIIQIVKINFKNLKYSVATLSLSISLLPLFTGDFYASVKELFA